MVLKDTAVIGMRTSEGDCEAYIRKGVKNWPIPGETDHQEGDEQKNKTTHFLFFTVLLKSDLNFAISLSLEDEARRKRADLFL